MPDSSDNVNARDGASIVWGPEIRVEGKRPEWLRDSDKILWSAKKEWGFKEAVAGETINWRGANGTVTIRLPANHPHYRQPTTPELDPALWDRMVASHHALLAEVEAEQCEHEQTHRGGAIWTICDDCGQKWADDRGGFQPYVAPDWLVEAREIAALADLPKPVDPDLIEARKIVAARWSGLPEIGGISSDNVLAGKHDTHDAVACALAAIKRGRELAAPEVSHVG